MYLPERVENLPWNAGSRLMCIFRFGWNKGKGWSMTRVGRMNERCASPRRIAYFVNAFPTLSETFVLREMLELRKQGAEVHIFSLSRGNQGIVHKETVSLVKETNYVSDVGRRGKFKSVIRLLSTRPLRLLRTIAFVRSKNDQELIWSLKQAIYLAAELRRLCVQHIHAHFVCFVLKK